MADKLVSSFDLDPGGLAVSSQSLTSPCNRRQARLVSTRCSPKRKAPPAPDSLCQVGMSCVPRALFEEVAAKCVQLARQQSAAQRPAHSGTTGRTRRISLLDISAAGDAQYRALSKALPLARTCQVFDPAAPGVEDSQKPGADGRLPYGDNEFDVVTCTLALEHWSSSVEALCHEVGRVLRDKGCFVLTVHDPCDDVDWWRLLNELAKRCLGAPPPADPCRYGDDATVGLMLRGAGLAVTEPEYSQYEVVVTSPEELAPHLREPLKLYLAELQASPEQRTSAEPVLADLASPLHELDLLSFDDGWARLSENNVTIFVGIKGLPAADGAPSSPLSDG
eukprot:TRINITY_DN70_c0_g1_i1.p1 TRINITY_DN70_c0_g1~~TRINITY_DN70_c0_g1_i1.p1  ORF type:complete len:336 (+),score=59.32 TRINITY_DN70_c0_g1_i1:75-1082(+)